LFTSGTEGFIKVWNLTGKEFICELNGEIHSAVGKKPNISIIGPESDDPISISNLPKGVNAHPASIRAVRCTHDSKYLFSADLLGKVRKWNIESRLIIKQYRSSHRNLQLIKSMQVTEDPQTLLIANDYGYLKIFHIAPP
jgi:WD40 repeat protein